MAGEKTLDQLLEEVKKKLDGLKRKALDTGDSDIEFEAGSCDAHFEEITTEITYDKENNALTPDREAEHKKRLDMLLKEIDGALNGQIF